MTTTYKDIEAAIRTYVSDNAASVNAEWTVTRILWPNVRVDFTGMQGSFLNLQIMLDTARQANLGALRRIDGQVEIGGLIRKGEGQDELMVWQDSLRDLFAMGTTIDANGVRLLFREPIPSPMIVPFEGWAYLPLECPFYCHA